MHFTKQQLEQATRLKELGLAWKPAAGHYIYDVTHALKPSSPFQDRVYFLLDLDCFLRAVGGPKSFERLMVWLPSWEQARSALRSVGVADDEVSTDLARSLDEQSELNHLYDLLERTLR